MHQKYVTYTYIVFRSITSNGMHKSHKNISLCIDGLFTVKLGQPGVAPLGFLILLRVNLHVQISTLGFAPKFSDCKNTVSRRSFYSLMLSCAFFHFQSETQPFLLNVVMEFIWISIHPFLLLRTSL